MNIDQSLPNLGNVLELLTPSLPLRVGSGETGLPFAR